MAKRLGIALLLAVLVCVSISACTTANREFTIKITANPNLPWSGSYMVMTAGGESISRSVNGVGPWQVIVKGSMVSVCFQKSWADGSLQVQILEGGRVAAESETTAEYGVVTVATGG
jgi:hypothetical protein